MSNGTHFEVYLDHADEYRWRLVAGNGRIVADSGEGYDSARNAWRAAGDVHTWATMATEALGEQLA